MPWGTSGHCLLMIVQLCLQSTDLQFDLKSFLSSVSDPKALTNSACCLFYVSHYRAIHILLFFSFFSPPPTFINKLRQSIPNHGRKLQIKTKCTWLLFFPIIDSLKFLEVGLPPVVFLSGILKSIFGHGWPWTDYNGDWNIGLRADSKIPPILFQFISFFQIISSSKEMEGALSRMRTLPWRGMFALFGGFLITVSFFEYKIMMLRVVWCLIVISFFSCHWAPSIHSAIWWPTWHLIWGGKNMLNKQYVCGRFLLVLKSNLLLTGTTGLRISPMGTLSSFRACGAWHKWVLNLAQWLQMNLKWIRVSVRTVKCLLMNLAQRSLC